MIAVSFVRAPLFLVPFNSLSSLFLAACCRCKQRDDAEISSMPGNKKPNRKGKKKHTSRALDRHTLQGASFQHDISAQQTLLILKQLCADTAELEDILFRSIVASNALADVTADLERRDPHAVAAIKQEFDDCLRLMESKERWAYSLRTNFAHRVETGKLLPKSWAHDPEGQAHITEVLEALDSDLEAFSTLLAAMREKARIAADSCVK